MWNGKLAGNMDISMYLESNLTHMQPFCKVHGWKFSPCTLERNICLSKVQGNSHVPCKETYGKVHGDFHVPWNETYGMLHGNFLVPSKRNIWQDTWTFPYFAICFVASYPASGIAKKYHGGNFFVSVYPCCPKKHGNFRRPAYQRTLRRSIEHI